MYEAMEVFQSRERVLVKENILSEQIYTLRKRRGLTQEVVAEKLGVTPQSISRWENGQSRPDVDMLPKIAAFFDVSVDALFGYRAENLRVTEFEKNCKKCAMNWGDTIRRIERKVLKFLPPTKPLSILNIACGEGQSAIFFARNGYIVSACDTFEKNLDKAKNFSQKAGLEINFFNADILNYEIETKFDIIFADCGALQYIPPRERARVFKMFQAQTNNGGLSVLSAIIEKNFIEPTPDWDKNAYSYETAELFAYYGKDWKFELMEEIYFDCSSEGVPHHRHCMDQLIARKIV